MAFGPTQCRGKRSFSCTLGSYPCTILEDGGAAPGIQCHSGPCAAKGKESLRPRRRPRLVPAMWSYWPMSKLLRTQGGEKLEEGQSNARNRNRLACS